MEGLLIFEGSVVETGVRINMAKVVGG